jgi:photosystem II stability/assembly factor-like uncharacterized protein
MRTLLAVAAAFFLFHPAFAQFDLEESHSTASLRGIDSVGAGVAWASGSNGTVLRTEDGGYLWQTCSMPKGAEKLDFRGIQAFDAKTAVVMSSGTGPLSKVYRTTDGCQTWKLVFENPDGKGFFDALRKVTSRQMYLLGDPVDGKFAMFYSPDQGATWYIADDPGREAAKDAGAFAASNSSFVAAGNTLFFGTGATPAESAKVYRTRAKCPAASAAGGSSVCSVEWVSAPAPLGKGTTSSGIFSLAVRSSTNQRGEMQVIVVAVGGDYAKPDDGTAAAATSKDGGEHWERATTGPGGYRSGVAYDSAKSCWIAVGPNGVDLSRDDGANWTPLAHIATDPADDDKGWNAISLPFVVGAKGKIGKLREGVLGK